MPAPTQKPSANPVYVDGVLAILRQQPRPEGVPTLLWFYLRALHHAYSKRPALYSSRIDDLEDVEAVLPTLTADKERQLTARAVWTVMRLVERQSIQSGYGHEQGSRSLHDWLDGPQRTSELPNILRRLLEDAQVGQVTSDFKRPGNGYTSVADTAYTNFGQTVLEAQFFLQCFELNEIDRLGISLALLHLYVFNVDVPQFLAIFMKEAHANE